APKQLRELLPVPTRLDRERRRRLPAETPHHGIGTPADDARERRGHRTRGPPREKRRQHDLEVQRENVFRVGIRNGAGAQPLPQRTRLGIARGGKEKGVAGSLQIALEQVEPERPGVGLDEKPARPKAEKPLIARQKRPGKREKKPHDRPRRIANTQTVVRGRGGERVRDQEPAEAPFNAQRIFTAKTL